MQTERLIIGPMKSGDPYLDFRDDAKHYKVTGF